MNCLEGNSLSVFFRNLVQSKTCDELRQIARCHIVGKPAVTLIVQCMMQVATFQAIWGSCAHGAQLSEPSCAIFLGYQ